MTIDCLSVKIREKLLAGTAIPAHPLALNARRTLDERRQRGLTRYYIDAGVGGVAIGVHTTQFEIRDKKIGLYRPVLALAAEEFSNSESKGKSPLVRIAGVCGNTLQAMEEAAYARELGYHAALVSLAALNDAAENVIIQHCKEIAQVMPIIGFYLQSSVGGMKLPYDFWRKFVDIENVAAIKIAPFNRYATLDVIRAVIDAGREDIALYTGNDDTIVMDLLTPYRFKVNGEMRERRIVGGLLGHWAVWTRKAVELQKECREIAEGERPVGQDMLARGSAITDCNAAFFDTANEFAGCIAGLHEVLRRQGMLEGIWCLNPEEKLGPRQKEEIDRVYQAYPHLNDDAFVAEYKDEWLRG